MKKPLRVPKINCTNCIRRSTCTQLCKSAERYVSQDYVPQREGRSLSSPSFSDRDWPSALPKPSRMKVNERDVAIAVLVSSGIARETIREMFDLSTQELRNILRQIRRKVTK